MNLSENFTLEELTASEVALRKGIDNTPDAEIIAHLTELATGLEEVRRLLGVPMHINSGYRSPKVNIAVGGSATSAHCDGYAADFVAPQFGTPVEVCRAIRDSGIKFDQIIFEGTWTHLSFDPKMRQRVLTAHFSGGKATYTAGIT